MKSIFEFEDWTYQLINEEELPSTTDKDLLKFHETWNDKIESPNDLPMKSLFSFEDFVGLHGWVSIEKVLRNPFDLLPVLHGSNLRDVEGGDYTNIPISEHNKDPRLNKHDTLFIRLSELAAEYRCPYYSAGTSVQNHQRYFDEWYGFPTVCENNQVSHFYSVLRRTKR